ncbi:competence/damage-inducible protein A [Liberiplasma polymorphum]|uniref:competence/damage-inducible protein A n=1 Tax=Liberiplasma polymorphum TaxID=3374570 RepID=UPI00377402E0
MQATIITIGNELLNGKTINTNLNYLSKELRSIGIKVSRAVSINDEETMINETLDQTKDNLIIFTGGLGPTKDDLTKESVCKYFNLELHYHEESYKRIELAFARMNRTVNESNKKQAYFPKESIILPNQYGTAPGVIIQVDDKIIVLLPGPPQEMHPMFSSVKAYLEERVEKDFYEAGFLVVGIGESDMEGQLTTIYEKHDKVNIAPYAGLAEIQYIFTSPNKNALEAALNAFQKTFDEYIVGPYNMPLEERVVEVLMAQNKTISFAESCTGGLLAGRLINVPNASQVFNESYVLYSNESKIRNLGVNQMIIDKFGAVSDQCVYELAYQAAHRTRSDIAMSISGVAGPGGGSSIKPVGTVYFGLYHEGKTKTYHRVFAGDRQMIRYKAVTFALYLIYKALMHEDNH